MISACKQKNEVSVMSPFDYKAPECLYCNVYTTNSAGGVVVCEACVVADQRDDDGMTYEKEPEINPDR